MRFNGVDVRDIHPRISISKEIPPGCPERTVETVQGWDGETFAAVRTEQGEYLARINIACRTRDDAWEARSRLARWAASSGDGVGELEPTHWPGKAYEAVLGSISAPEFTFGFATVDVTFILPRPYAHDTYISRASGTGGAISIHSPRMGRDSKRTQLFEEKNWRICTTLYLFASKEVLPADKKLFREKKQTVFFGANRTGKPWELPYRTNH